MDFWKDWKEWLLAMALLIPTLFLRKSANTLII